ncbi:hemin uptake protein HemP [Paraburkholderia sp. CNPSo 3272]|uniref:hemin uptake protein HemP n=1 Tax=Paraburkholderia sp. CNPSo 3272 TaxID=2940931 RepID=UPI0020B80A46|nr:hemin uptake protein HemP [Paraburkholderia sp. CNPSo 3272]MCP3721976.1 hemin uptake protein HemP [Paraburkholderia sp. CNPSo 3272]
MTELNRTSTLSLRRNGSSTLTSARPKAAIAQPKPRISAEPAAAAASDERKLESAALLQGRSHVSIMHNGETYQLRATRLGKLILTK